MTLRSKNDKCKCFPSSSISKHANRHPAPVLVLFHWPVSPVEKVSVPDRGESPDDVSAPVRTRHCFPRQTKSSPLLLLETPSLRERKCKK